MSQRCLVLGSLLGAMLLFCCVVPRRTESYFRTDLPRAGEQPVNRAPTNLPPPDGLESFVNSIGMRMIRVPTGDLTMGSPADEPGRRSDEQRRVLKLSKAFWVSQTEVTQAEWNIVMEYNPSRFVGDRLPVQNIRISDAWLFCKRLGRLEGRPYMPPTELEWEYACRAGTLTAYNTGPSLGESQAHFAVGGPRAVGDDIGPRPVGSYPPNPWGLYDMHGNVGECCGNPYNPRHMLDIAAGEIDAYSLLHDDMVFRGGSWDATVQECRSAARGHFNRHVVEDTVGFRVIILEE